MVWKIIWQTAAARLIINLACDLTPCCKMGMNYRLRKLAMDHPCKYIYTLL